MSVVDVKHLIYKKVKKIFDDLNVKYPDKIRVKVRTSYPREIADIDQDWDTPNPIPRALITIVRNSMPGEQRVITNVFRYDPAMLQMAQVLGRSPKNRGRFLNDSFTFSVWATNPDYRDYILEVLRESLFDVELEVLREASAIKFMQVGGNDMEIDLSSTSSRTIYRGSLSYIVMYIRVKSTVDDMVESLDYSFDLFVPTGANNNEPYPYYNPPKITISVSATGVPDIITF